MKLFTINTLLTISFFLLSAIASAKTPDEIIEGKKRAVLLITIREKGDLKSRGIGGGFFTDNKGHFVTNLHVIEAYLQNPQTHTIQIQLANGDEFSDVEIEKCGNENKLDLCYGKINTDKKIYFIDVINRSPNRTEGIAIIGHNGEFFSVKKGEVIAVEKNIDEKFGVPLNEQENKNTSMVQLGKYEYKSGSCKGDSGSPVFDYFSGDLIGVFTNCIGKKGQTRNIYAIDSKEVYSFINGDSKFTKVKIPADHIYKKSDETVKPDSKGNEFQEEKRTGKLE